MKKTLIMFLILCIIEFFFRVLYPHSQYSVKYASWGWKHIPNTTVKFYGEQAKFGWGQKPVIVEYDKNGLRDKIRLMPAQFRILLLGDSWLEDMGSCWENLVDYYLQPLIFKKFDEPNLVINAGHYGFDNAQELMWYLKEGKKYSPNIVILFYANDRANPENAIIKDDKLVLKWREFTQKQKIYRNIASWIRLNTNFGSWLLTKIQRIKSIRDYLVKEGMKEPDNPVVGPGAKSYGDEFRLIDRKIYLRLKEEIEKDGAVLIMLSCIGEWPEAKRKFFDENNIRYMHIPFEWPEEGRILKEKDLLDNMYISTKESHRFGYKQNEKVAERIAEYLNMKIKP